AYVFGKPSAGWTSMTQNPLHETAKLTASGGVASSQLGASVAITGDGSTVVAGAPTRSGGAAYVYEKPVAGWASTSTFNAKLTAADGAALDDPGVSVAISSDASPVVAGDPIASAAYVYEKPVAGWASTSTFNAKLTDSDPNDGLGYSVVISSDSR